MKTVNITNGTGTFTLEKDQSTYSSYWVCTSGRCPGTFSKSSPGMIVPSSFQSGLFAIARETGYSEEDLASPKRPVRAKASKSGRKRGVSVSSKKPGINIRVKMKSRIKVAPLSDES